MNSVRDLAICMDPEINQTRGKKPRIRDKLGQGFRRGTKFTMDSTGKIKNEDYLNEVA